MLPTLDVTGSFTWGEDVTQIPEYAFCVDVAQDVEIHLSSEHVSYQWCNADEAIEFLEWESNRAAIQKAETMS